MGLDATNKWPGETDREWGRVIKKDPAVTAKIDEIWERLGFVDVIFYLEFILQIVMEMIGAMFEGTVKILRLDWRKRKLSQKA